MSCSIPAPRGSAGFGSVVLLLQCDPWLSYTYKYVGEREVMNDQVGRAISPSFIIIITHFKSGGFIDVSGYVQEVPSLKPKACLLSILYVRPPPSVSLRASAGPSEGVEFQSCCHTVWFMMKKQSYPWFLFPVYMYSQLLCRIHVLRHLKKM